jgi:hypothetical protein
MKVFWAAVLVAYSPVTLAQELPIFDAHIHYSHDAVELIPPVQVAKILRESGVVRALVSSSDDDGTQQLVAAAPDIVVPALRPYRRRGEISTWMHDPTIIDYVEGRLARFSYKALGEFHAYGEDIKTPVLQRMIALAKEHDLLLHAHSDAQAIDLIFESYPKARVLWAHSGFDRPDEVRATLHRHKNLWSDLAYRSDMASRKGVDPEWRAAFEEFPDRFVVGTDTFAPERWFYVGPHADFSREWLANLPADLAKKIAFENATQMLGLAK